MKAFQIAKNGRPQCLAGVGAFGVLTVIATWIRARRQPSSERIGLTVGGLTERHEHLRWAKEVPLAVGDEITIRVVNAAEVDRPMERRKRNRRVEERSERAYYERLKEKYEKTGTHASKRQPKAAST